MNAKKVVVITDNLVEYPLVDFSIPEVYVDYVVAVDQIGNPAGIVSGTTKITRDPVGLVMAQYAAKVIEHSGLLKDGMSFQTGAGGASLAAAKYLKGKFPQLKIGGPAVAFRTDWAEDFLSEMAKRNVPLDFFSWHGYRTQPGDFTELGRFYRALLDKYGYTNAENHVNEWNYIRDWTENFVYSIETIGGCKGAAFDMAAISAAQDSPIDMMMYYDTRPSSFCGLFDYYTYRPKKPYYVFYWYGSFYDCAHFIPCQSRIPDIFTLCGMYADGKTQAVLTYYTDKDGQPAKTVTVDLGRTAKWDVYLLDETHNAERIETTQCPTFTLQPNTCMLLKEVD